MKRFFAALRCPVCGASMTYCADIGAGQLACTGTKPHMFDCAKSGYVHLAPRHSGGGDARDAVRARTAFLSAGYYRVAVEALDELLRRYAPDGLVVDAGCGEGYYTNTLASHNRERFSLCGFDLSRDAVDAAAKRAKREGTGAHFAVASLFALPLQDATAAAVINVFAPCAEAEFCRVLRPEGMLITVGAGERHLLGLKQALYETTYENTERADLPHDMMLCERKTVKDTIRVVGQEQIEHLFSMTPYYFCTSPADREKLRGMDRLVTEIEFDCRVYRRVNG